MCFRSLVFIAAHFTFVAATISHFLIATTNFHIVLPTKKCLFFLPLTLGLCISFSRGASLAYCLISLFLQICGHSHNVHFPLGLCITRRGWLWDFPPKKPGIAFGLPYLLIELFYIGIPMARKKGRSVGVRSRDY